ncbi:hypothetical protein PILCRDRAFT_88854 [Piloderma croceum F 1598]|uniref:Uncharacterized protein n=1 Tax=Piloderma croceum (strain F 1598) TaxID=765440 RepID=A0A0C3B745_PILCF|nr:hypothetical protein PILCRDRAFT_88854 [Piloderma croceum F 1598]
MTTTQKYTESERDMTPKWLSAKPTISHEGMVYETSLWQAHLDQPQIQAPLLMNMPPLHRLELPSSPSTHLQKTQPLHPSPLSIRHQPLFTMGHNCVVSELKEEIQRRRAMGILKDIDPHTLELWKQKVRQAVATSN